MATTLAHLSDLHVLDLTGVRWWRYLNKRITGAVNLVISRSDAHPVSLTESLVADVRTVAPDHVAITGDLTNLAFDSEFTKAAQLLEPLGGFEKVSVIPGNHDIYTAGSLRSRRFERHFGHLMWTQEDQQSRYPWTKRVGDELTLIGLRSAHPVAPLFAHGWVEREQLEMVTRVATQDADRFVVVMLHHNLHRRSARKTWMHGLRNRDEVLDVCADAGVDLVLHGHTHVAHRFAHRGMPVIGCGSSTWSSENPNHVARYNLYRIDDRRLVDVEVRTFDLKSQHFESSGHLELEG